MNPAPQRELPAEVDGTRTIVDASLPAAPEARLQAAEQIIDANRQQILAEYCARDMVKSPTADSGGMPAMNYVRVVAGVVGPDGKIQGPLVHCEPWAQTPSHCNFTIIEEDFKDPRVMISVPKGFDEAGAVLAESFRRALPHHGPTAFRAR
jgi:hypothetical protein